MSPRVAVALRVAGVVFCLLAIGGSFVLSFDTWVSIGQLAGFGALAIAMPLCVDGHVMTALTTWLSPVSARLAAFARYNLYAIGAASVIAQSTYHGIVAHHAYHDGARTLLAVGAGAFPPIVATLAVHLAVGIVRESFVTAKSELEPTQLLSAELSPPRLAEPSAPVLSVRRPDPSPEAVIPAAASQPPLAGQRLSAGLSTEPTRPAPPQPSAARAQPTNGRVSAADVARLAGLERAEIAKRLGTSVATVDRRLREIRASRSEGGREGGRSAHARDHRETSANLTDLPHLAVSA